MGLPISPTSSLSEQSRVLFSRESGSVRLASVPTMAWLASWALSRLPFGPYPLHDESAWCLDWDFKDVQDMIEDVLDESDGSMEPIPHIDVEVAGAALLLMLLLVFLMTYVGRHAQDLDGRFDGSSHIHLHLWTPANSPKS